MEDVKKTAIILEFNIVIEKSYNTMIFKVIIVFAFLLLNCIQARTQSFIRQIATCEDEYVFTGIEIPQCEYLIYQVKGEYSPNDPGRIGHRDLILKIGNDGTIIDSIEFIDSENLKFRADGFISLRDQFIFWGCYFSDNDFDNPIGIRIMRMDYQFNTLHDTSIQYHDQFIYPGNMILNSINHLILPGRLISTDFTTSNWFCREMDIDGGLIQEKHYTEPMPHQSIVELTDNHTYHLMDFFSIVEIDSSFNFIRSIYSTMNPQTNDSIINIFNPKAIDSLSYLVSGNFIGPSFYYQDAWGLMQNRSFTSVFNFGSTDTNNYNSGMDFISTCAIYSSVSHAVQNSSPFMMVDNEMLLYCTSITRTINWELRYGNLGYILSGVPIATSDSGCLWLGNYWDWHHKTNYDFDAIMLKINPDGTLITGQKDEEIKLVPVLIFPNPGKELEISTMLDYLTVRLYNSLNDIVLEKCLSKGNNKISSENLSSGIYYYLVEDKSRIIVSGKWIKIL